MQTADESQNKSEDIKGKGIVFWETQDPELFNAVAGGKLLRAQEEAMAGGIPLVVTYSGALTKTYFTPGAVVEVVPEPKSGLIKLNLASPRMLLVEGIDLAGICSVCIDADLHRKAKPGDKMCHLLLNAPEGEVPNCRILKVYYVWRLQLDSLHGEPNAETQEEAVESQDGEEGSQEA